MTKNLNKQTILKPHIALPTDHGSWVFLLSPLIIGLAAGQQITPAVLLLILSAMMAFLIRQPITILVKVYSRRRGRSDLSPAILWTVTYGFVLLISLASLILLGYVYLLWLAVPGIPVFVWHLVLISRRAERRQAGVEIVATGVLALSAPAAYWVAKGNLDPTGWWLFLLTWLQSAASIVYAYLRLEQRELSMLPDFRKRLNMEYRAVLYTSFNLITVFSLIIFRFLPFWLYIPFLLQWVETIYGTISPAIGKKPTQIGIRQLIVSTAFTFLFILTWNL